MNNIENLKEGDVTNYGRIEAITIGGNVKITGREDVIGSFREIFKVNCKNENEVEILTNHPLINTLGKR